MHQAETEGTQLQQFEHVVLTNGSYLDVSDGSINTQRRLVEHLRSQGVRVTVLCSPASRNASLPPGIQAVPSLPVPFQNEYRLPLWMTAGARNVITTHPKTLVHVGSPDTLGIFALRQARKKGVPVVTSFHSNIISYFQYFRLPEFCDRIGWCYFRWFYRQFDQVYVPTKSMADELHAHGVEGKFLIWPRGVDHHRFNPERRSQAWRREIGCGEEDVVVMFTARLKWEKGLQVVADVFNTLHARDPRVRTVVVGDGVGYEPMRGMLPNTHFTGALSGTSLATAYASADLFFYPSKTDTFGNVTLEAMASGLPTVCATAPGSSSLVQSGRTGFLVNPEDTEACVRHLLELVENAKQRQKFSRSALVAANHYRWPHVMTDLTGYYARLFKNDTPGT